MGADIEVSLLKSAFRWLLTWFRSVKITNLNNGDEVHVGEIDIKGTASLPTEGDFVIARRDRSDYWPHSRLHFHGSNNTWTAGYTVAPNDPASIDIVILELNEAARALVNYYYSVGDMTKWKPIGLARLPRGITIFYQITIRKKASS